MFRPHRLGKCTLAQYGQWRIGVDWSNRCCTSHAETRWTEAATLCYCVPPARRYCSRRYTRCPRHSFPDAYVTWSQSCLDALDQDRVHRPRSTAGLCPRCIGSCFPVPCVQRCGLAPQSPSHNPAACSDCSAMPQQGACPSLIQSWSCGY